MANPVFKVKKGFLIARDNTTGNYLPFFLNVRSNDILWKGENGLSDSIKNMLANAEDLTDVITPNTMMRFNINQWKIFITSPVTYKANLNLPITNTWFRLGAYNADGATGVNDKDFQTELLADLTFPTTFTDLSDFNIVFTLNTPSDVLSRCTVSFVPKTNGAGQYTGCYVRICSPSYRFSETFYYDTEFINSRLNVELTGYHSDFTTESEGDEGDESGN